MQLNPKFNQRYKAYVGPKDKYDLVAAMQFNLLTSLGLRENHYLLDIGCGSLRAGKLFIPYLSEGRYYGIEPNKWLVEEGFEKELGKEIINIKKPVFDYNEIFNLDIFGRQFDFLLAHSIFSHASKKQISKCLNEAKKVMNPKALFAATFIEKKEDYEGDKWIYPDTSYYTYNTMEYLAKKQKLVCKKINWQHPNAQKWIIFTNPEVELRDLQ